MKIIKIKNCFNCPLSQQGYYNGEVISRCESGSNLTHSQDIIKIKDCIPTWCPLEEE